MKEETCFRVRLIADTEAKRARGLMFAEPLEEDEAAFFVFPKEGQHTFWNQNVAFDLDLAFLDENGRVVHIAHMKAEDPTPVGPPTDNVRYVVEAKKGALKKFSINKGDTISYHGHSLQVKHTGDRPKQHEAKKKNSFLHRTASLPTVEPGQSLPRLERKFRRLI